MTPWTGVRGKRVLMTGGTNGIGLAAAMELARRGAELAVVVRSQARAAAAAAKIQAAGGGRTDVLARRPLFQGGHSKGLAAEVLERYPALEDRA
jgi:NAD(P)-dependent dehydrogenase (short-subunit alcohol dehydrogenase family)